MTGLGSSTYYNLDVIRITCMEVIGATVSSNCTEIAITTDMAGGELDPQLP